MLAPRRTKLIGNVAPSTIFVGDNLHVLRGMEPEIIDLIYLDPPFNSKHDYAAPIGGKDTVAEFKDTWSLSDIDLAWNEEIRDRHQGVHHLLLAARLTAGDSMMSYLTYMAIRILQFHRVLKKTGSIYLHCDTNASHYLKLLMDAVFGKSNFKNDIVWCYTGPQKAAQRYPRKHDCILFYGKGKNLFNKDAIRVDSKWNELGGYSKKDVARVNKGKVPEDWWQYTFGPRSPERTGYPTQKPLAILKRIILASSNEGGVVLDPFCGCATTLVAAQDLGRHWIGIDISRVAVDMIKDRFAKELGLFNIDVIMREDIPIRLGAKPTAGIRTALFALQNGCCNLCGERFDMRHLTRDHITPKEHGGPDIDENLQLLCGNCNSTKGTMSMANAIAVYKKRGRRLNESPVYLRDLTDAQLKNYNLTRSEDMVEFAAARRRRRAK